ncbi:MAG: hypothetical protein ACLTR6_04845 [Clostridium fessum]
MEEPGFWDDPERSTKTVREAKNLKDTVDGYIAPWCSSMRISRPRSRWGL